MSTAYERVQAARSKDRPVGTDYIENIFTDFFELHGDRRFSDDPAIVGGVAMLKDVLTCVDDFHPSSRREEQELTEKTQMLARSFGDRVGRGRLNADSSLMPSRPPRGNAILTAEM